MSSLQRLERLAAERDDELAALAAIFGDEFVAPEGGVGAANFSQARPYAVHISHGQVRLVLRWAYPEAYPAAPLDVHVGEPTRGFESQAAKARLEALRAAVAALAEQLAADECVAVFEVQQLARDSAQALDAALRDGSLEGVPVVDALWGDEDEWQTVQSRRQRRRKSQRDEAEVADDELSELHAAGTGAGAAPRNKPNGGGRDVRQALVLGQLLRLVTGPHGPMPGRLNVLASELRSAGVVPSWLHNLIVRPPDMTTSQSRPVASPAWSSSDAMASLLDSSLSLRSQGSQSAAGALADDPFEAVFGRVFHREAASAKQGEMAGGSGAALAQLWCSCSASNPDSGDGKSTAVQSSPASAMAEVQASRYETDFEEKRTLGAGGFGTVVLAINRYDGIAYAIKKVRLSARSPALNAKILREVTTLSSLSSPNVVRYYSAWIESSGAAQIADDWSDDDWLSGTATPSAEEEVSVAADRTWPVLLIQMEFCPRTLRAVLDSPGEMASVDEARRWAWTRDMLKGLAHTHASGVAHRDIKPANLFLSSKNFLLLGDFGLARCFRGSDIDRDEDDGGAGGLCEAVPRSPGVVERTFSDATSAVGTALYAAPEVLSAKGLAKYDTAVDLYSLGIVLYEAWTSPFATGMERVVELSALRQRGLCGAAFAKFNPQAARLIDALVQADPSQRPTAAEVLRSDLLPPLSSDEQLGDTLRMVQSDHTAFSRALEALASFESVPCEENTVRAEEVAPAAAIASSVLVDATGKLAAIAAAHGCTPVASQALLPSRSGEGGTGAPQGAAVLLDTRGGVRLTLRSDLRSPLLRTLPASGISSARVWQCAPVWRCSGASNSGLPRQQLAFDVDIVERVPDAHGRALLTAELARIACEAAVATCSVSTTLRIGHRALLGAALNWVGLEPHEAPGVLRLIAAGRGGTWEAIEPQLEGMAVVNRVQSSQRLAVLWRLATGDPGACVEYLLSQVAPAASSAIAASIEHLRLAIGALGASSLVEHLSLTVRLDPLLSPARDAFSGTLLELSTTLRGARSQCVAAVGGEYCLDAWRGEGAAPVGFGLTFAVSRLAARVTGRVSEPLRAARGGVLVTSHGGSGATLLAARLSLLGLLWDAGVVAEGMVAEGITGGGTLPTSAVFARASAIGARYIVSVSEAGEAAHTVSLRDLGAASGRHATAYSYNAKTETVLRGALLARVAEGECQAHHHEAASGSRQRKASFMVDPLEGSDPLETLAAHQLGRSPSTEPADSLTRERGRRRGGRRR